jgi:hypothetical protein
VLSGGRVISDGQVVDVGHVINRRQLWLDRRGMRG